MPAIREQILVAVLAQLQAITGVTGLTAARVERNRRKVVTLFPFLVLRERGHGIDRRMTEGSEIVLQRFDVELYVQRADVGTALNELYAAVKAKLAADVTLGGLIFDLREEDFTDPLIASDDSDRPSASAAVGFVAEFQVLETDPSTLGP